MLFLKTASVCSSLSVRDQVSHPYKTIGRIMVLYILTFITLIYSKIILIFVLSNETFALELLGLLQSLVSAVSNNVAWGQVLGEGRLSLTVLITTNVFRATPTMNRRNLNPTEDVASSFL
jgi:hypothetical protein